MKSERLACKLPIIDFLNFIKKYITKFGCAMIFYISYDIFPFFDSLSCQTVFKIQKNDIIAFFTDLIHDLFQNDGFSAASNPCNDLDQITIVESTDFR